jgi:3-oxoacyl-[acyl-carrier protein] reductase
MGHPGAALYAIAKASVDASIKQLALEYAPLGVRVVSVAPGLIDTPAIDNLGPDRERFMREVGSSHAMRRYGDPMEVAEVIAFLCSERASFMTGGPIYVDGGTMLRSSLGDAIRPFTVGDEEGIESEASKVESEL